MPAAVALRRGGFSRKGFVNQNEIVSDLLDAVPRDVIFFAPQQAEKAALAIGDDCADPPLRQHQVHILSVTDALAVTNIDNLLASQVRDSALLGMPPFPICRLLDILCSAPPVLCKIAQKRAAATFFLPVSGE